MKTAETNEAFTKRMVGELDKWQDGKRKERVALLIMQDETGTTTLEAFGNNRGKNPELRFIGRMTGIVANNNGLYNAVLMVAKFACKIRNRKQKGGKDERGK